MVIRNKLSAIGAFALVVGLGACASEAAPEATSGATSDVQEGASAELSGTVQLLLPNTTTTRFTEHDGPAFVAAMADIAPGVTVDVLNAEGDGSQQLTQVETAISQGSLGVVVVSADPSLSGAALAKLSEAGIPVVAYEHEAIDGPVDYQVMFDPYRVGEAMGQYFVGNLPEADGAIRLARIYGNDGDNYTIQVKAGQDASLNSLIESGDIEVVCEDYAAGWDPANAQQLVEQCLTRTGNEIDAVLVSNDGTASGAIAALAGQQLSGMIPVYGGQDANLEAVRFILQGLQQDTVFKNYALEGRAAAELIVAAITGSDPGDLVNDVFDNKFAEIPAAMLGVSSVDANNVQVLVDEGLYTKEQICEGLTNVAFCDN